MINISKVYVDVLTVNTIITYLSTLIPVLGTEAVIGIDVVDPVQPY